jgi:hypothetical protein
LFKIQNSQEKIGKSTKQNEEEKDPNKKEKEKKNQILKIN